MIPELAAVPSRPASRRTFTSILAATVAILFLTLTTLALLRASAFYSFYTSLLAKVTETTGLDLWASRAVALALLALLWFLPWHLLLLPWIKNAKRQVVTLLLLAALGIGAMEFVTRDVYFSRSDGHPRRYYIKTLDGYKFAALAGVDPKYGLPYQPITPQVARDINIWKHRRGRVQDPTLPKGRYFDSATGEPLRWYAKFQDGRIDIFTLPGFHPTYGTKLLPATTEVVSEYEKQLAEAKRQRQASAERKARQEAKQQAREKARRQAREQERLQQPLQPGRYLFADSLPKGRSGELLFTLTEIDLVAERMIVHLAVENVGPSSAGQRFIRFGRLTPDGVASRYTAIRPKEGAFTEASGSFNFPPEGRSGAFIMEFKPLPDEAPTFSLTVNDQPLFSGINLHKATYQSF